MNAQAEATGSDTLINCASQEYFGAVALKALKLRVITPSFQEDKGQGPATVSFFAKRARGAMARYIVQNQITDPRDLADFNVDGYTFTPALSSPDAPAFVRPYPVAA